MCSLLAKPGVEQCCSGEGYLALSSLLHTIKQSIPTIPVQFLNNGSNTCVLIHSHVVIHVRLSTIQPPWLHLSLHTSEPTKPSIFRALRSPISPYRTHSVLGARQAHNLEEERSNPLRTIIISGVGSSTIPGRRGQWYRGGHGLCMLESRSQEATFERVTYESNHYTMDEE